MYLRAKGNYKPGSDVDIALKGSEVDFLVASISGELNEETPLPYTFDVVAIDALDNEALKEHIQRVGVSFYKKGKAQWQKRELSTIAWETLRSLKMLMTELKQHVP